MNDLIFSSLDLACLIQLIIRLSSMSQKNPTLTYIPGCTIQMYLMGFNFNFNFTFNFQL